MKSRNKGVTLIELVVVIAVIGILASIAVPSYREYVRRANRSEARAALLALATAQEKYYLECNSYTATLDSSASNTCPGSSGSVNFPATSEKGYYTIAVTGGDADAAGNPQSWTATATAASGQPQIDDTKCRVFQLTSTGRKTAKNSSSAANDDECWSK